jgi:hypothetical protein
VEQLGGEPADSGVAKTKRVNERETLGKSGLTARNLGRGVVQRL